MQELRLVAVSEDGTYAVLAVPGQGGRFALPIDERLRVVARGQFSRLAQYEIEVERPLRPKEIQDRIRAGETAEEIAEAAGVPIDRVRRFEGPVLAERAHWAGQAQEAAIRAPGDSGPGRRLGDVVAERLAQFGVEPDSVDWDSRKRPDGVWQVQLSFTAGGSPRVAEWQFDPRRRHVAPVDDTAAGLCLPDAELPAPPPFAAATVTPIGSRLAAVAADAVPSPRAEPAPMAAPARAVGAEPPRPAVTPAPPMRPAAPPTQTAPVAATAEQAGVARLQHPAAAQPEQPGAAQASRPASALRPAETQVAAVPARPKVTAAPGAPAEGRAVAGGDAAPAATGQTAAQAGPGPAAPGPQAPAPQQAPARERPARRSSGRSRRSSVPSWDEIMFGTSRQSDEA